MSRIIDAHVHLSESRDDTLIRFARMNGLGYTLDELVGSMRTHEVERALLLSPPLRTGGCVSNEEIIQLCRKSDGMILPVVTVEPTAEEVKAAVRVAEENRDRIKAFKIRLGYVKASAESPVFDEVYDYAQSKHIPILFHTGDTATSNGDLARSHPLTLDGLANKREELTIVLCHFGNPWFEDVAELLHKHPNVYTDMSGLITGGVSYADKYAEWLARKISDAIYFAGNADKVIFGTDYPVTKHSDALALARMLEIDERDKEKILWRNAERVFRL